jgi:hypothetical protein
VPKEVSVFAIFMPNLSRFIDEVANEQSKAPYTGEDGSGMVAAGDRAGLGSPMCISGWFTGFFSQNLLMGHFRL